MIKTWNERCEDHPDHNGIVTERMIQARMQEEIDELRAAIEQPRQWQGLTPSEITAIELSLRQYHDGDRYDLSLADFASAIEAKLKAKNA